TQRPLQTPRLGHQPVPLLQHPLTQDRQPGIVRRQPPGRIQRGRSRTPRGLHHTPVTEHRGARHIERRRDIADEPLQTTRYLLPQRPRGSPPETTALRTEQNSIQTGVHRTGLITQILEVLPDPPQHLGVTRNRIAFPTERSPVRYLVGHSSSSTVPVA